MQPYIGMITKLYLQRGAEAEPVPGSADAKHYKAVNMFMQLYWFYRITEAMPRASKVSGLLSRNSLGCSEWK